MFNYLEESKYQIAIKIRFIVRASSEFERWIWCVYRKIAFRSRCFHLNVPGRDPDSDPDAVLVHQILFDMNLEQKEEQYTQVFNAVY